MSEYAPVIISIVGLVACVLVIVVATIVEVRR